MTSTLKFNILVVIASKRELLWWNELKKLFSKDFSFSIVNASATPFQDAINLTEIARTSSHWSPKKNERIAPTISDLYHEMCLYPNRHISFYHSKFITHYLAYKEIFNQNKFDCVLVENGGFIFINSLVKCAKDNNIPIVNLEPGPYDKSAFAYYNSKGPLIKDALKSDRDFIMPNKKNESKKPLVQYKDRNADKIASTSLFRIPFNFFNYLIRRYRSPFINTDGSFWFLFKLKTTSNLKRFFIQLHDFKSKVLSNKDLKSIIVPLHLGRDLAINERFGYRSQISFVKYLIKRYPNKQILFKLHPHSIKSGLTIRDHVFLLFTNSFLTKLTPDELFNELHEVHTLGSKYGFEAHMKGVKSLVYGDTFFTENTKDFDVIPEGRPPIERDKLRVFLSTYLFRISLYNHDDKELLHATQCLSYIINKAITSSL